MQIANIDSSMVLTLFTAFFLAGLIKGAIGAGSPVIAIPFIAMFFDVKMAVTVMALPNLFSNLVQVRQFMNSTKNYEISILLSIFGLLGCFIGSIFFTFTSTRIVEVSVAIVTLLYVVFSISRFSAKITLPVAKKLSPSIGIVGGFLQGTCGVSAPVALAFLNSIELGRDVFIFTISCFFAAMAVIQILTLLILDFLTTDLIFIGIIALLPLFLGMSLGNRLAKKIKKKSFENLILIFLTLLSIKLISPK